jgi:hypothetical protein
MILQIQEAWHLTLVVGTDLATARPLGDFYNKYAGCDAGLSALRIEDACT